LIKINKGFKPILHMSTNFWCLQGLSQVTFRGFSPHLLRLCVLVTICFVLSKLSSITDSCRLWPLTNSYLTS